jgi:uncharacterized protein YjbJ (UPF0337 family)
MTSSTTDKLKGRLKEAAGALAGDEKLKREGQLDQAAASVKETVEEAVDAVKDFDVKEAAEKTVDKVKDVLSGGKKS